MKVSVIMNCLNCTRYLREAVDSVYAQSYCNWEIIFWDNASEENVRGVLGGYDSRLRYFRGTKTVPLGEARNLAMAEAKGDLIAFLDCDDIWLPKKLEKQVPVFADPEVGLVFSDAIHFNEAGESRTLYSSRRYHTGMCFSELLTSYFLDLETVVIGRAVLEQEPVWFDPRFQICEESDFFTRIAYRWKLAMINEPLAKWRIHGSSWTWTKGYLSCEETAAMLSKYCEIFPNFSNKFAKQICVIEKQISIGRAKNMWKAGNSKSARKCLAPYLLKHRKAFCLFLLTFFPERLVFPMVSRFRRTILPVDY